METKKWYLSTTVWACIVGILNAFLGLLMTLKIIPVEVGGALVTFIGTIAGIVGINGRLNADTKIG